MEKNIGVYEIRISKVDWRKYEQIHRKIERYFGGYGTFKIEASTKEEAKREILKKASICDNYILSTLKIKKVQKFKN